MAKLPVNPTRMELTRLKARLKTCVRGHKLLKDKSDEMIRRFMELIRLNKRLREEAEAGLIEAQRAFMLARAVSDSQNIEEAVAMPSAPLTLHIKTKNIMGVDVPAIVSERAESADVFPYSFLSTASGLDAAVQKIDAIIKRLIELAALEKTCNMLAFEIEKNRRRVNALEYVQIPQINETIRYIRMKLEENERGNLTRLMKVKDMIKEREE